MNTDGTVMSSATTSISRMVTMVVVVEVAWQLNGWRTVLYLRDNLSSLTSLLVKGCREMIIFVLCSVLVLSPDIQISLINCE